MAKKTTKKKRMESSTAKPAKKKTGRRANGTFTKDSGYGFQPGQSGNPAGRPNTALLSTGYKQLLAKKCTDRALILGSGLDPDDKPTWCEVVAMGMIRAAVAGKTTAAKEIRETTEGTTLNVAPDWRASLESLGIDPDTAMADVMSEVGDMLK